MSEPAARPGLHRLARVAVVLLGMAALAPAGAAQTVERIGSSDVSLDRRLARLLAAEPLVITEDRRVRVGDTIHQSVLVLDATVILEGTVTGDLVVVDAGVFVRHEATVEGDLVNIGGGLYRSERARIGGTIIDLPDASYRVVREDERILIEATRTPSRLELDGFGGVRLPVYDRVNGVTAVWGASYRLPRVARVTPRLRGHVGWRTALGEPVYGAELELRSGALGTSLGYELGPQTRDNWAVGDTRNSLNFLWDGDDFRDYYESERAWLAVTRELGDVAKRFHAVLRVAGQVEDAGSLPGSDPWHFLRDTTRANPPVDDGRISSAIGRLELAWHGLTTDLEAGAEYEAGRSWYDGEYTFDRVTAWARVALAALFDHTLEVRAFGQMPVGSDTLPRQRWTLVGGAPTISTAPVSAFRGDHALFVESLYRIPAPEAVAVPLLGVPELQLVHAAGRAWLEGGDDTLVQEIGGRLQFFSAYVQYMVRPADPSIDEVVVGLAWPFTSAFPWER